MFNYFLKVIFLLLFYFLDLITKFITKHELLTSVNFGRWTMGGEKKHKIVPTTWKHTGIWKLISTFQQEFLFSKYLLSKIHRIQGKNHFKRDINDEDVLFCGEMKT